MLASQLEGLYLGPEPDLGVVFVQSPENRLAFHLHRCESYLPDLPPQ